MGGLRRIRGGYRVRIEGSQTIEAEEMARRARLVVLGLAAAAVLAADQLTKLAVRAATELGSATHLAGPFWIHHVRNSGIIGGHFQGVGLAVGVATIAVIAALIVYVFRSRTLTLWAVVGFGLLLGGSLGNLIDRLRLGYVTDFIDRGNGKAFNLADVAILLGIAVVLVCAARRRSANPSPSPDTPVR